MQARPFVGFQCKAVLGFLFLLAAGCGDRAPADLAPANVSAPAENVAEAKAPEPLPDVVRVRLETEAGPIVVAVDAKRAPVTAANFVRYVREGRLDGTSFYRAARTKSEAGSGFIQGGIRRDYKRMLPPISHEPTSETGLRHEAGTISMARAEESAGAMGNFFITLNRMPAMDAGAGKPGYAAFGKVVEGMDVVRSILAAPTSAGAGRGAMKGQMLEKPVRIVRAREIE
jgi:peptidyl-prolyl cis-trans isomerase A (cyclophilin A)